MLPRPFLSSHSQLKGWLLTGEVRQADRVKCAGRQDRNGEPQYVCNWMIINFGGKKNFCGCTYSAFLPQKGKTFLQKLCAYERLKVS